MVGVLEEVARCGFSPLDKDDALAHVLTKSNTCTFLTDDTKEFFVDPEVRLERSGVTASTQLVRVLIPVVLQQRKPRQRAASPQPVAPSPAWKAEITALDDLRKSNIISADDYETGKKKILHREGLA